MRRAASHTQNRSRGTTHTQDGRRGRRRAQGRDDHDHGQGPGLGRGEEQTWLEGARVHRPRCVAHHPKPTLPIAACAATPTLNRSSSRSRRRPRWVFVCAAAVIAGRADACGAARARSAAPTLNTHTHTTQTHSSLARSSSPTASAGNCSPTRSGECARASVHVRAAAAVFISLSRAPPTINSQHTQSNTHTCHSRTTTRRTLHHHQTPQLHL